MLKRLNSNIVIALFTSFGIIAFAFNQRYGSPVSVPAYVFYLAATIISVLPHFYARFRYGTCRNK